MQCCFVRHDSDVAESLIDVVRYLGADLLHVFSYLPKDLNFIEHTSDIGWKE